MSGAGIRSVVGSLVLVVCASLSVRAALAQVSGIVMDFDPSVISTGMGGASGANFWGAEPNAWANPALLGLTRRVSWQTGNADLIPDLVSGITYETSRLTLGGMGVGLQLDGRPGGFGGAEIEFSPDPIFSPGFPFSENTEAFRLGVSLGGVVSAIARARGAEPPPMTERFDLAFGYAWKHTVVDLAPGFATPGEGDTRDFGVALWIGDARRIMPGIFGPETRVDLAAGVSMRNYSDQGIAFPDEDATYPATRAQRQSVALRLASAAERKPVATQGLGALLDRGLDPWVAFVIAYDHVSLSAGGRGEDFPLNLVGMELSLLNIVSLRGGYVSDDAGEIHGASYGFGIQMPLGAVAGLRYDFASWPQADDSGLDPRIHHSMIAFVDPLELARALR